MNSPRERAREIVDKHLARPDWVDVGSKDCFVCGTPLDKVEYMNRSEAIVEAIANALTLAKSEGRREGLEEAAKIAEGYFGAVNQHLIAQAIRGVAG